MQVFINRQSTSSCSGECLATFREEQGEIVFNTDASVFTAFSYFVTVSNSTEEDTFYIEHKELLQQVTLDVKSVLTELHTQYAFEVSLVKETRFDIEAPEPDQ